MLTRWFMLLVLALALTSAHPRSVPGGSPPAGFTDVEITTVPSPTSLAFLPDGRMLVASQSGQLYLYDGALHVILDLSDTICDNAERGLLGVTGDPEFATNRYVYVYYTANRNGCDEAFPRGPANRVSRFIMPTSNVIDRLSETLLVNNILSTAGNHNGGDVKFGRDGYLYVSIGDGGCDYAGDSGCQGDNDASRDDHVLNGKILRITRDGGIPVDNPFLGPNAVRCNQTGITDPGKQCQETWAKGLRNPFRIAVDHNPGGSRLYINDVGGETWEEIDEGVAGADYGWNIREGHCARGSTTDCDAPPPGLTNPLVDYNHDTKVNATRCTSITGGAFAPYGWPLPYHRAYFFGDLVCGTIFWIAHDGQGTPRIEEFATGVGSIVAMDVGPTSDGRQALYYTTYSGGGQVRRITYDAPPPGDVRVRLPLIFR